MDLIKLSETNKEFPVDARDLHAFLAIETPCSIWIQRKCEGLEEGLDFVTNLLESGGRPIKVFNLTIDAAKHCSMTERSPKGKQIRQWFIEREKLASKPMSPTELALWSAQALVDQERRLKEQEVRLVEVEKAVSYDSIHQMVQDSLEEETINVFPRECSKLETIRETVFVGISTSIISQFLNYLKHPTKEYKFKMADNVLRSITVFSNHGLVDAFNRFRSESMFQKTTKQNDQYYHPIVGNYRIKK